MRSSQRADYAVSGFNRTVQPTAYYLLPTTYCLVPYLQIHPRPGCRARCATTGNGGSQAVQRVDVGEYGN